MSILNTFSHGVAAIALTLTCLHQPAWAEQPTSPFPLYKAGKRVLYAAKASTPIAIDGDLGEWPATDTLRLNVEQPHSPLHHGMLSDAADMDILLVTAWTDSLFYFGARVYDDVHQTEGQEAYRAFQVDGLAPYFDLDHDEDDSGIFWEGDHYFWITAEPTRKPGTLWWGPGSAEGYHYTQNFDPVPGLDYAVQLLDDGYIMEASIAMGTNGLAANSTDWHPPFLGRTIGFMVVAVDKDDARNLPFGEMVRLSEGDGSYDWGEIAWCGSDDRQSGWGNLVFIDRYDPDKHKTHPHYLK